jgi:hypothetical protein
MTGRPWNSLLLTIFEGRRATCAGLRNVGRQSKHFFSQGELTMKRVYCALMSAVLLAAFAPAASAATIYRETFGRPTAGAANILGNIFDWPLYRTTSAGANSRILTSAAAGQGGVSGNAASGKPTNVENINAGTNEDGTTGAYPRGIYFFSNTTGDDAAGPKFAWTPEYTFNPGDYTNLTFSWYQGDAATTSELRLAIRVGGQWYASATAYANTAAGIGGIGTFNANAQLMSLVYSPAAANWLTFAFDGTYDTTTDTGTDSTVALALGAAPGSNLSGPITAFGLLGANDFGQIRRFDTFQIDGDSVVPEPSSVMLAISVLVGLLGAPLRRK